MVRASLPRLLQGFLCGAFLDALEFEGAFFEGGGVAVDAHGQLEGHFVLGFDHFRKSAVIGFALGVVVGNHTLQLLNEPPDDNGAKSEEEEERGEKEPAVVHARRVVDGAQKLVGTEIHVGHSGWLIDGELMVER